MHQLSLLHLIHVYTYKRSHTHKCSPTRHALIFHQRIVECERTNLSIFFDWHFKITVINIGANDPSTSTSIFACVKHRFFRRKEHVAAAGWGELDRGDTWRCMGNKLALNPPFPPFSSNNTKRFSYPRLIYRIFKMFFSFFLSQ